MSQTVLDRLKEKLPAPSERAQLEAVASGSGVPFHTLLKIVNNATKDPRASTVQRLLDYVESRAA